MIILLAVFARGLPRVTRGWQRDRPNHPAHRRRHHHDDPTPELAITEPQTGTTVPDPASSTTASLAPLIGLGLEVIDQDYNQPTAVRAPAGDDRLFVVQRVGVIRAIDANNEMLDPAFLAIDDRVLSTASSRACWAWRFIPTSQTTAGFSSITSIVRASVNCPSSR